MPTFAFYSVAFSITNILWNVYSTSGLSSRVFILSPTDVFSLHTSSDLIHHPSFYHLVSQPLFLTSYLTLYFITSVLTLYPPAYYCTSRSPLITAFSPLSAYLFWQHLSHIFVLKIPTTPSPFIFSSPFVSFLFVHILFSSSTHLFSPFFLPTSSASFLFQPSPRPRLPTFALVFPPSPSSFIFPALLSSFISLPSSSSSLSKFPSLYISFTAPQPLFSHATPFHILPFPTSSAFPFLFPLPIFLPISSLCHQLSYPSSVHWTCEHICLTTSLILSFSTFPHSSHLLPFPSSWNFLFPPPSSLFFFVFRHSFIIICKNIVGSISSSNCEI